VSPESPIVSLDCLPRGTEAIVRKLQGGSELAHRLAAMGLTEGVALAVLQNTGRGPLLINVRDTRIALGRGEAVKILVEPTSA